MSGFVLGPAVGMVVGLLVTSKIGVGIRKANREQVYQGVELAR